MQEQKAIKVLKEIKKVLDNHKIKFWLNYGTLLGAIRDGKFIPWDTDIDLCLKNTTNLKLAIACTTFKNRGFEIKISKREDKNQCVTITKNDCPVVLFLPHIEDGGYSFKYVIPNGIAGRMLDYLLWTFKLREPKVTKNYGSAIPFDITNVLVKICSKLPEWMRLVFSYGIKQIYQKIDSYHIVERVPSHFFEELKEIDFYGMNVNVPKKAEDYLLFLYGKDWKKPIKGCIYGEDTQTIVQKCKYGTPLKK